MAADRCDFREKEREIKDQVVFRCKSDRLRRKALREDLTLTQLLEAARAMEMSEKQAKAMEGTETEYKVDKVEIKRFGKGTGNYNKSDREKKESEKVCFNCGGRWPHENKCPAFKQKCRSCGELNHFARQCKKSQYKGRRLKAVKHDNDSEEEKISKIHKAGQRGKKDLDCRSSSSSSDESYLYRLEEKKICQVSGICTTRAYADIEINGKKLKLQIDSGSDKNVLSEKDYEKIKKQVTIHKTSLKLYPYNSKVPIKLLGKFSATIQSKHRYDVSTFYVAKGSESGTSLLSLETAVGLGVIKIINNLGQEGVSNEREKIQEKKVNRIVEKYKAKMLFHGVGRMKGVQVKLHVDKTVKPVAVRHRRVPFALREKLEEELEKLEKDGIIESVYGPTEWVSPIVVAKKRDSEEIRMCVDMRQANRAIKRTRHVIPTLEELRYDVNGAVCFSKLDLAKGFHQLELHPDSRDITTFATHVGLKRFCRLLFGASSASEVFHNKIRESIADIRNVFNIHDDIFVYGKTDEEHNVALEAVLERLLSLGLTLKLSKCEFNKKQIKFFGLIFSKEGVSPDPEKVNAIKLAGKPANAKELSSFLGMASYSSSFISDFASIAAPLRELTHKDMNWEWKNVHEEAFQRLKTGLSENTIMTHYDPRKKVEVICDASPVGLGAMLMQEGKTVAYASRTLSSVEQRYSQIEKEGLAIMFGCLRFQIYLSGRTFVVVTDHKPLVPLFNNPRKLGPARIERIRLRLQGFNFTVIYRPGENNPTDYISRHPLRCDETSSKETRRQEGYLNMMIEERVPEAISGDKVKEATDKDEKLKKLREMILMGKQINTLGGKLDGYKKVWDELSVCNGILMKGEKIVIPEALEDDIVKIAHEGHMGIVKCKQFLRSKVWFPKMDKKIETEIFKCLPCQAVTDSHTKEAIKVSELPSGPWEQLSMDFWGPTPSGEYLFVLIDNYSLFPEIEIVSSTSAKATIPKLDKILSAMGIPSTITSDNGPPFNIDELRRYSKYMGFHHRKITPFWPQANGMVENFMRSINKLVKTARVEGKNWKQEIFKFLRNFRSTPHPTTGVSPASLMFQGRQVRSRLPEITRLYDDVQIRNKDADQKRKMKYHADKHLVVPKQIEVGDQVLVKQKKDTKFTTTFKVTPYMVVKKKGSMLTATNKDGHTITRNRSFFKLFGKSPIVGSDLDDSLDDNGNDKLVRQPMNEPDNNVIEPVCDINIDSGRRYPQRERRQPEVFKDYQMT